MINFFLRSEPALIQKIARPDDIETRFCQETDGSLPPLGPMVGRIQGDLLDVLIAQRLNHGVSRHMKRCVVFLAQHFTMCSDPLYAQATGVHPVGSHLATDIRAIVGHTLHKLLQQIKVLSTLVEPVGIVGHVQHPAMHPDRIGRHALKIRWTRIPVIRRAGETHLVRKEFVFGIRPVSGFGVGAHI